MSDMRPSCRAGQFELRKLIWLTTIVLDVDDKTRAYRTFIPKLEIGNRQCRRVTIRQK